MTLIIQGVFIVIKQRYIWCSYHTMIYCSYHRVIRVFIVNPPSNIPPLTQIPPVQPPPVIQTPPMTPVTPQQPPAIPQHGYPQIPNNYGQQYHPYFGAMVDPKI